VVGSGKDVDRFEGDEGEAMTIRLADALGLSRSEADDVLKRHRLPSGPATVAELRAEVALLRAARPE
jgi:hypothetical protein